MYISNNSNAGPDDQFRLCSVLFQVTGQRLSASERADHGTTHDSDREVRTESFVRAGVKPRTPSAPRQFDLEQTACAKASKRLKYSECTDITAWRSQVFHTILNKGRT